MLELLVVIGVLSIVYAIGCILRDAWKAAKTTEDAPRAAGLRQDQHTLVRQTRIRRLQLRAERARGPVWWDEEEQG